MAVSFNSHLTNVFQPAMVMSDPRRFAGRRKEIEAIGEALAIDGSTVLVFGDRGLGKSSIARQAERIAHGDSELLETLALEELRIGDDSRYCSIYVDCTDEIVSTDDLLNLLLQEVQRMYCSDGQETSRSETVKKRLNFNFFHYERTESFQKTTSGSVSLCDALRSATYELGAASGQRVLLIVDEFDRLRDSSGFASVLKALSSDKLKFVLVGIANSISSLLADHQSLARSLYPIEVPTMEIDDLTQIIDLVEQDQLEEFSIEFEDAAKTSIADLAGGYPWFVHTLAQESLNLAVKKGKNLVSAHDVHLSQTRLSRSRFAKQFEDLYLGGVGRSRNNEIVLRMFGMWSRLEIPTSEIYPVCKKLGVAHPGNHVRTLVNTGILSRSNARSRGMYSFSNGMFQRYVQLRPSIFDGIKSSVEESWKQSRSVWTGQVECNRCGEIVWKLSRLVCPKCSHPFSAAQLRRVVR